MCRRDLSEAVQTRLGDQKEHWRYKSKLPVNSRATALSARDPFADLDAVRSMTKHLLLILLSWMSILRKSTNSFCTRMIGVSVFPSRCNTTEHIALLEGRGVITALRHKLRSCQEFGHKHLPFL